MLSPSRGRLLVCIAQDGDVAATKSVVPYTLASWTLMGLLSLRSARHFRKKTSVLVTHCCGVKCSSQLPCSVLVTQSLSERLIRLLEFCLLKDF